MATPLQSSGQISLNDIRQYIGQSGEISLSNITTSLFYKSSI